VLLPVWIALAFFLLCLTGGAVLVFLRVRALFKDLRAFSPALQGAVSPLDASLDRLDAGMQSSRSAKPRLDTSVDRLRRSLAQVAVLRAAVDDVREAFGRLTAVYPRK